MTSAVLAMVGFVLMFAGAVFCFMNSGGLVKFLTLRNLQRHGVEGKAVSILQEWISSGHRVYYEVLLPDAPEKAVRPDFVEIGPEPRGPVGTVVPVVYDPRKPKRAKTGVLEDIDPGEEWFYVKFFWGPGLACIAAGAIVVLVFH